MYVRTECTQCKNPDYHNIKLHAIEHMTFEDHTNVCRYTLKKIEVTDTTSEEEFASTILKDLRGQIQNGMTIKELCRIITEIYGVADKYCCDLVQRIKLELGMYSPDGGHLYYA
jgi:hypothetical protein